MNQELKQQWITALESGKYKKGKGSVCEVIDGQMHFCCLGVLANITNTKTIGFVGNGDLRLVYKFEDFENNSINFLHGSLSQQIGNHQTDLAKINDITETFDEVVEYIKENL